MDWICHVKDGFFIFKKFGRAQNVINGAKYKLVNIVSALFYAAIHWLYMHMEYKKGADNIIAMSFIVLGTRKLKKSFINYTKSLRHN